MLEKLRHGQPIRSKHDLKNVYIYGEKTNKSQGNLVNQLLPRGKQYYWCVVFPTVMHQSLSFYCTRKKMSEI